MTNHRHIPTMIRRDPTPTDLPYTTFIPLLTPPLNIRTHRIQTLFATDSPTATHLSYSPLLSLHSLPGLTHPTYPSLFPSVTGDSQNVFITSPLICSAVCPTSDRFIHALFHQPPPRELLNPLIPQGTRQHHQLTHQSDSPPSVSRTPTSAHPPTVSTNANLSA